MSTLVNTLALIGFESRDQNLLEVFFSGSDAQGMTLSSVDNAAALLINMETPKAIESFLRWRSDRQDKRPVIALVPPAQAPAGVLILPPPLTLSALKKSLRNLKSRLKAEAEDEDLDWANDPVLKRYHKTAAQPQITRDDLQAAVAEAHLALAQRNTEVPMKAVPSRRELSNAKLLDLPPPLLQEIEQHSCGGLPDMDLSLEANRQRLSVNLQSSVLSMAQKAVDRARLHGCAVQVQGVPGQLVYFPRQDEFSYDQGSELLLQMTRVRFAPEELRLAERPELKAPDHAIAKCDEFIWFVALMTARGRLPWGVRLDKARQLQQIPDFERLLKIPHCNSIAELWRSAPHTPRELADFLAIPQRFVFSFMVAADALGLFNNMHEYRKQGGGA